MNTMAAKNALYAQPQQGLMRHPDWIVVHDPAGAYEEGSLVDGPRNHQLQARGVVTLPIIPDLFTKSGVGGYMRRGWGAGYPVPDRIPRMHAPVTLFATEHCGQVHWRARLVPSSPERLEAFLKGHKFEGSLRMTPDTGQSTPYHAAASRAQPPVDLSQLEAPDEDGGWVVGGPIEVRIAQPGHYGFALFGTCLGLRVAWVAASIIWKGQK